MTRYRKKPVEVEAWQVGSDEPMPEWLRSCDEQPNGDYRIDASLCYLIASSGDYVVRESCVGWEEADFKVFDPVAFEELYEPIKGES